VSSADARLTKVRAQLNELAPFQDGDERVLARLRAKAQVPVEYDEQEELGGYRSPAFGQHKVTLHPELKNHVPLLAHELGHDAVERKWWGPLVQNRMAGAAHMLSPLYAAAAGAAGASVKRPWLRHGAAPVALALSAAPTLLSEHTAWKEGKRLLQQAGGTERNQEDMDNLRRGAMLSYSIQPVLGLGAGLAGALAGRRLFKRASVGAARRVVELYMKTASPELVQRAFPALSAAFDSYSAVREQERQAQLARNFTLYPGLTAEYTMSNNGMPMGGNLGQLPAQPAQPHHRRHRHHSG
jgi:hypothetical protein